MQLSLSWKVLLHALLLAVALAILVPLLYVLGTAFKPPAEVFDPYPWPQAPTLANFRVILEQTPFVHYFINSVVTTVPRMHAGC